MSTELPATHLWPGDRIRRGSLVYLVDRVAVTHGAGVVVDARRLVDGHPGEAVALSLAADELMRHVEG